MLQYVSQLYVQASLKFFTLQPPEMLQYVSQLYVQVLLSSLRYNYDPEMLQYDSKLYVQVLLSSLRYNSWNVAIWF